MENLMDFNPNWVSIPGSTIQDVIIAKKISIAKVATQMKRTKKFVDDLINGQEAITNDVATGLADCLGANANFWLSREKQYREALERVKREETLEWIKELPLSDMIKYGWIRDMKDKVTECLNFFNVSDVKAWRSKYEGILQSTSFRTSETLAADKAATIVWLRQGEIVAEKTTCKKWNEEEFEETLNKIKVLTRKKNPNDFLPELRKLCSECGVALVIARTPNGCRASGATRFVNDDKALLLLSFRYLSDDQFWFTFFHEAGHILLHKSKTVILEGVERNDSVEEKEANIFASEILIPYDMQSELYKLRGKRSIISFAMKAGVSPGIVIGQMQHRGIIDFKNLNTYKRRYDWNDISI